jgi:hypothetical protein
LSIFWLVCWITTVFRSSSILENSYNNNNNQAFYSQASWGRLEMKPHEQKKGTKQEQKEGENKER